MRHKRNETPAVEAAPETPEARLAVAERNHQAAVEDLARFDNAKADAAAALAAAKATRPVTVHSLAAMEEAKLAIEDAEAAQAKAAEAEQIAAREVHTARKAYEADRLRAEVEALPAERDALLAEAREVFPALAGKIAAFKAKAEDLQRRMNGDLPGWIDLHLAVTAAAQPFLSTWDDTWNPLLAVEAKIAAMAAEAAQKARIAEREEFLQAQVQARAAPPAGFAIPSPNEENRRNHPEWFPETRTPQEIEAAEFAESVRLSGMREQNAASATPNDKVRPSWDYDVLKGAP